MTGSESVLLISNEFPPGPGGIGNHAFNLAKHLNLKGLKTDVLTVSDFVEEDVASDFDRNVPFSVKRHGRSSFRPATYISRISEMIRTVAQGNYSHIVFTGMSSLIASLTIPKGSAMFISIAHGGDVNSSSGYERMLVNKALIRSDLIIPVSNFSASKITAEIDRKKIRVIPNGFDFENIEEIRSEGKRLKGGDISLVSVGTVWPRKGHHNVIRAMRKLTEKFPGIKYNVVGRVADMSKVNEIMSDELNGRVVFHGQTGNAELQRVLSESDIFILLSETQKSGDFEGFGIAVIEANFFGLPAIGSRSSGLEDAISNGVSGVLVDPANDEEITAAVEEICNDYYKYSIAAVEWAKKHHWSRIVDRYIAALRGVSE